MIPRKHEGGPLEVPTITWQEEGLMLAHGAHGVM